MKNNCKFAISLPNHDVCDAFWETEVPHREKNIFLIKSIFNFCFSIRWTSVSQKAPQTSWLGKKMANLQLFFIFTNHDVFFFLMSLFVIFIQKYHGWCLWRKLIKKKFMFVKSDFMQNYDIKKIYFSSTFSNKNVMVDGWWKKKWKTI